MANGERKEVIDCKILLSSSLFIGNKCYSGSLTKTEISWTHKDRDELQNKHCTQHSLKLAEVFGVSYYHDKKHISDIEKVGLLSETCKSFVVNSIQKNGPHKWRSRESVFSCLEASLCQQWVQAIQQCLNETHRPSMLLVFVNPVGGKKQGQSIFMNKVQPLFDIAKIKTHIIVTQRANHARDSLQEMCLDGFDGVVSVGGDGMFNEILNGLLIRSQSDAGLDTTNPNFNPSCPRIPLGIIPAGSTDATVHCTTGTNDPVTSALQIIMGETLSIDVCSVKHKDDLLRYSVSLVGYGFLADVVQDSEKIRWMGPTRYDFSGFKKFMANRYYDGEVWFVPSSNTDSNPRDRTKCKSGCSVCSTMEEETKGGKKKIWQCLRGQFISINSANISCACSKIPQGLSPSAHLGDGCTDLILVKKTSRVQYLRHLIRIANRQDQFDFEFVEVHRVKEFKFNPFPHDEGPSGGNSGVDNPMLLDNEASTAADKNISATSRKCNRTSSWNVDGELVEHAALHVRVHKQLVVLFGHGIEENEETTTCGLCGRF